MSAESKARPDSCRRAGAGKDAPRSRALDWVEPNGAIDQLYRELDVQLRRRKRKRLTVAVSCAAVLLVTTLAWRPWAPVNPTASAPLSAVVSAPARQMLPDGSIVDLNGGAVIRLEFSAAVRRVVLSTGEAHFLVMKNAARPFVVAAGGIEVRAVGTAFSVQLGAKAVDVLVTEGRIAIDAPATATSAQKTSSPEPTYVDAGSRAVVEIASGSPTAPAATVQAVTFAETRERLAWRAPRVEFTVTPLAEVAAVFREHAGVRLRFDEPEIGKLELSGVLRADNVDSLLRLLEAEFRIRAERREDEIILRR
jgi:transmembrane sensor